LRGLASSNHFLLSAIRALMLAKNPEPEKLFFWSNVQSIGAMVATKHDGIPGFIVTKYGWRRQYL
jgi:hypothetical protein